MGIADLECQFLLLWLLSSFILPFPFFPRSIHHFFFFPYAYLHDFSQSNVSPIGLFPTSLL